MKKSHIKIWFTVLILIMLLTIESNAKYVLNSNATAAILNIDRTKPVIEVVGIKSDTTTTNIITTIRVLDKNIKNNIDIKKINVIVDNKTIECSKEIINTKKIENGTEFDIMISNIKKDKIIKLNLLEGFIKDESGNISQEIEYEIKIVYL